MYGSCSLILNTKAISSGSCITQRDITFQGNKYIAFPFKLADVNHNSTDLPNVKLSVSNVTKDYQRLRREDNQGFTGANVIVRVINTNIPNVCEVEEHFVITGSVANAEWMEFTLGTDFSFTSVSLGPHHERLCPLSSKGVQCGYKGNESECNKTLSRCRALGNSVRFGGEPTIPQGGLYASNK